MEHLNSPQDIARPTLSTSVSLMPEDSSHSHLEVPPEEHHHIESNISSHKYLIRRPRALLYIYQSRVVQHDQEANTFTGSEGNISHTVTPTITHQPQVPRHSERAIIEKHRERLDLFIDLIWVGIIGNLSEVYTALYFSPESNPGVAVLVFTIAFLPTWRIWNLLREFLNNYYMDDILQRGFILWILVLSVYYGNNLAYLPDDIDKVKGILIPLFLVIRSSFVTMEAIYSIWIPWLRRQVGVSFLFYIPGTALWIGAIFIPGIRAAGPLFAALVWEYIVPWVMESQIVDKFLPAGYRKATDPTHFTTRMQNFFIITVGEGVLSLIRSGPLGIGIQATAGTSVWSLVNYLLYVLLYFNRGYSKTYLSAVRHNGVQTTLWISCHIPIFACFVLLSAATTFILRNHSAIPSTAASSTPTLTTEEIDSLTRDAIWTIAASLSIIMTSMTILALLDKPLDKPGTLLVDNRYLRMICRPIYIAVILGLAAAHTVDHYAFLSIAGALLVALTLFEWTTSMERGGGLIEPKGIAGLLKTEIVPGRLGMHKSDEK